MRDLVSKLDHEATLNAATATATATGTGVDGADGLSVSHLVNVGESGDTLSGSVLWTITAQESDTLGSGYTACAAEDVIVRNGNTVIDVNSVVIDDAAEDDVVLSFGYIGSKRYSRVVATATGTHTNGTPIAMSAVKESKIVRPAI